jgi:Undecaprenyl-phosphate galactose phosphotransferase WbaP
MSSFTATQTTSVYALDNPSIQDTHRPGLSAMFVLAGDILGLSLILWALLSNAIIGRYAMPSDWLRWSLLLPSFLVLYWFFDLYPGVSVNPVAEIRRISLANICAFLFIAVMFALNHVAVLPYLICLPASVASSGVILAMRALVRLIGSQYDWWGYPVVLFGRGEVALFVLRKLMSQPHLGLSPVAVVADNVVDREIEGIPVFKSERLGQIASSGIKHAIVAAPELSRSEFAEVIERGGDAFPHLIFIPDMDFIWKVESYTRNIMGIPGIQIRNNLFDSGARVVKRTIDLASSTLLLLLLLPIIAIISLSIVVESGFPVFYLDKRLGYGGWIFHMWKFRTMAQHSAEVLNRHLATNSELQREWAQYQKLRNDPRITRVGRVLRKTSLDELPQLWNVIRGEMSLVGPRPRLLEVNVPKHQAVNNLYAKTTPGLTGLWQVSGRSRTTYEERIAYDAYYIRNWSVWMDIYLLAKTIGVVIRGDGAY